MLRPLGTILTIVIPLLGSLAADGLGNGPPKPKDLSQNDSAI